MIPHILIYTDHLPANSNGAANGPVVRIRPAYRGDEGLLQHELTHVRQWWRTLGLHSILYLCSKQYRLKAEVEAYRIQLDYLHPIYTGEVRREMYATWLSIKEPEGYGLQSICTKASALELLS